jgi:phenylacetate-CoA ligase
VAKRSFGKPPAHKTLDDTETMSPPGLRGLQSWKVMLTVRNAFENVPFYRERFTEAGLNPKDCKSPDDLAGYPFTTKADLRNNYPSGMFAVPRSQLRRIHASSGTTGQPTLSAYTEQDIDDWATLMARSIRAAGGRPGMTVHVAYGYGLFTGGLGAHYGAERLGCTVIPASGGATARQVRLIRDLRPEVIMATPTYMLALLDEFERGGDISDLSLKTGIFGAEPWTEGMRAEIESRTGMHALNLYGLSEIMGPGVAQECVETKDGLTIWEDYFYPEIIDPLSGAVLPDGQLGELVLTTLSRQAMPLIRYRTGDLTRLLPPTARPAMRRMERITGRTDDMIVVRGVNVFPTQIEELLLTVGGLAPHFQLVLTRPARQDELNVRVEARPGASSRGRSDAAGELHAAIRDNLGIRVQVTVTDPGVVERSAGKMRRVLDERPQV